MSKQIRQPLSSDERDELVKSLQAEYDIIQTKIDNIGNFKFVVRGWLITIYSAFVFALFSEAISPKLSLFGIFIILVFHLLEGEQLKNQNKLSNRSKLIESSLYKIFVSRQWSDRKRESVQAAMLHDLISSPRISAVLTAKRKWNFYRKDEPKPEKLGKRILWYLNRSRQAISWFISFKVYWLFWILYFGTLIMHLMLNSNNLMHYFEVKQKKEDIALSEIRVYKNDNRHINHHRNMRDNESIQRVEDEMYSLVSQIDYGDISEIDTYWESLREALIDLEIEGWEANSSLSSPNLIGSLPVKGANKICEIANEMKELCDSGSNSSISDDELEKLQGFAANFETRFEKLLEELEKIAKK